MKRAAIQKANVRIVAARTSLAQLVDADDITTFAAHWYNFLTAAKNVYTILGVGSKSSPQSAQWFGAKTAHRRSDPLLQYLFQARDDDEHGLEIPVEEKHPISQLGVAGPGFSNEVHIQGPSIDVIAKGFGVAAHIEGRHNPARFTARALDGRPAQNRITPRHIALRPVTGRGDKTYVPPREHLRRKLEDTSPIAVARLGLAYLEEMVREAERRA